MHNSKSFPYDFLAHGDRRKAERRLQNLDRRGILRWDPQMKDRRLSKDRRQAGSGVRSR